MSFDAIDEEPLLTEPISSPADEKKSKKPLLVQISLIVLEDIEKECKHIAEAGYLGVKLFPHQEQVMSLQPDNNLMNPWYFMHQPVSYRLQGRMGTRDQLRKMIKTCRSYGVRVYADAVVNHMTVRNPQNGTVVINIRL